MLDQNVEKGRNSPPYSQQTLKQLDRKCVCSVCTGSARCLYTYRDVNVPVHPVLWCGKPCSSQSQQNAGRIPDSPVSPRHMAQSPAPTLLYTVWWLFAIWHSWWERDLWATRDTWRGRQWCHFLGDLSVFINIFGMSQVPEGVESPHVQHGEQLSFGFREGQAVTECLKGWDHQSFLGVSHVHLNYGLPAWGKQD